MLGSLKLWFDPHAREGPESMAVDEWLLETSPVPVLRIYQWHGAWGSLGYFGGFEEALVTIPEVEWVRRWTGGGLVDHRDDWAYTLVIPSNEPLARMRGGESYRQIHSALVAILNKEGCSAVLTDGDGETGNTLCFRNPVTYDIVSDNGSKLAGAGQRRTRHGLLHQGSVAGVCDRSHSTARGLGFALALCEVAQQQEMIPPSSWIEDKVFSRYAQRAWTKRR